MKDLFKKSKTPSKEAEYYAKEWFKCRSNPLYFIYNYVFIPEGTGETQYTREKMNKKMIRVVRSVHKYHKCILMASRQLGKSTISACLLSWALVFFPRNKAIIINMKMSAGLHNLNTIKFIISRLPEWMVGKEPFLSKGVKTYFELFNESRCDVVYPSTTHDPGTLARSLTVPCLYIDEGAFISKMSEIYGAAQPILATAREQAQKHGTPYFILVTSTPNGTVDEGAWFYDRWENAVDSDKLFTPHPEDNRYEIWRNDINVDDFVQDSSRNTFIRVKYHWSEDYRKTEQWYKEQCQELDNERQISQELDLEFIGTTDCIFSDKMLKDMRENVKPTINQVICPHGSYMDIYNNFDETDYYIIGCDTAESLTGADCAIQIFGFREFNQVGELKVKLASYTHFGEIIHFIFQWLFQRVGSRIILSIENNSIGRAPIEYLLNHVDTFNYQPFLFKYKYTDDVSKDQYGIRTTGKSKPLMIGVFMELITEFIGCINSSDLVEQCAVIQRTASGTIKAAGHSDLFMAACFCALARRQKSIEILPLLEYTTPEIENQLLNDVKMMIDISKNKEKKNKNHPMIFEYDDTRNYNEFVVKPSGKNTGGGFFHNF